MSDSKLKKAFNGAVARMRSDLAYNAGVAGLTTVCVGAFSLVAAPVLPLFAGTFFISSNLVSGTVGAYKSLKGPKS